MGFRAMILAGVLVPLLAACGGSGNTNSTSSSTAPVASGAPAAPIARRLLETSELPAGFSRSGQPSVATSVQAWLQKTQTPPTQVRAETARLKRMGFVAAASQALTSAKGPGISLVEQFRSPTGARAEFASQLTTFKFSPGVKAFPVAGIPKAFGFGVGGGGVNVTFADGAYYYIVGEAVPSTPANHAAVIAAAQRLYHRVHG